MRVSDFKKATREDKFARHCYANSRRFVPKIKRYNSKQFRQLEKIRADEEKEG